MNKEISILKQKIQALNNGPTIWALSDILKLIQEEMYSQTGLKLKINSEEINSVDFVLAFKGEYEKQLAELLKEENTGTAKQIDLEDSIKEIKQTI